MFGGIDGTVDLQKMCLKRKRSRTHKLPTVILTPQLKIFQVNNSPIANQGKTRTRTGIYIEIDTLVWSDFV